ncbi:MULTISPECIES: ribokinase [unclassified Brachybacterium]|uniref:ribokinase n=1 Tax=unclassified Brachybacterium TaxID=2623841 RepID=UPI002652D1F7|nr:ribokinase [Brachybacterium sp.]
MNGLDGSTGKRTLSAQHVLVVGSVNIDLVLDVSRHPSPGETIAGHAVRRSPGGKGANQACAAARLGAPVAFAGRSGTGPESDLALDLLRGAGTELAMSSQIDGEETGLAVVTVDASGENSIVVVPGANGSWTAEGIRALRDAIDQAAIVVAQGEIPVAAVEELAALCTSLDTRFLLNLAPVIPVGRETLLAADPLVVNEHEGRMALSIISAAEEPGDDEATALALRRAGVRSVVMTRGAQGAIVSIGDELTVFPSPAVSAVDTTGAGDAFVGALATGIARGESLHESCLLAVRVGASAVTRHGAQPSYPWAGDELP